MSSWVDEKVLITGGAGFIGRHLTSRLIAEGADVISADVSHDNTSPNLFHLDVTDIIGIEDIFERFRPSFVFHLASAGVTDPFLDYELAVKVNLLGTLNITSAAMKCGCKRIVITGTSHEFGDLSSKGGIDPISIYAASKAAVWSFLRAYHRSLDWRFVYLRLFQVYGPGQTNTLIPSAINSAREHKPFYSTPGEQVRDWIFIDDVIEALLSAAVIERIEGASFDVGTCRGVPVRDVLEKIFQRFPEAVNIASLPYRPGETWSLIASPERLLPGWKALVSLEEGLQRTIST